MIGKIMNVVEDAFQLAVFFMDWEYLILLKRNQTMGSIFFESNFLTEDRRNEA